MISGVPRFQMGEGRAPDRSSSTRTAHGRRPVAQAMCGAPCRGADAVGTPPDRMRAGRCGGGRSPASPATHARDAPCSSCVPVEGEAQMRHAQETNKEAAASERNPRSDDADAAKPPGALRLGATRGYAG